MRHRLPKRFSLAPFVDFRGNRSDDLCLEDTASGRRLRVPDRAAAEREVMLIEANEARLDWSRIASWDLLPLDSPFRSEVAADGSHERTLSFFDHDGRRVKDAYLPVGANVYRPRLLEENVARWLTTLGQGELPRYENEERRLTRLATLALEVKARSRPSGLSERRQAVLA